MGWRTGQPTVPTDLGAWARFLVAVGVLVLSEGTVETRLRVLQRQLLEAPLLAPAAKPAAAMALLRALRRRDLRLAELLILVAAVLISVAAAMLRLGGDPSAWLANQGRAARHTSPWPAGGSPSSACRCSGSCCCAGCGGIWCGDCCCATSPASSCAWSRPIPTAMAGSASSAPTPNAFAAFVFAMTTVVAAEALQAMLHGELRAAAFPYVMGVWLALVALLFALPLAAFKKPLRQLKAATLLACSAAATRSARANERQVLGRNIAAPAAADGEPDPAGGDPAKTYAAVRKLRTVPITKAVPAAAGHRGSGATDRRRGHAAPVQGVAQGGKDAAAVSGIMKARRAGSGIRGSTDTKNEPDRQRP